MVSTNHPPAASAEVRRRARGSYRTLLRIFLIAMIVAHSLLIWKVRGRIAKGDPDFTVFYTAARMIREGHGRQLYDLGAQFQVQHEFATDWDIRKGPLPYIHPPFEALLFVPVSFLPYTTAFIAWELISLGLLAASLALLREPVRFAQEVPAWEMVLAALALFPVFFNFLEGQDAILLLFCVTLGFVQLIRKNDLASGICFGLGLFKYQFILPLILILLLWKRKRVGLGFAVTGGLLLLISIAIVGWHGASLYPAALLEVTHELGRGQVPYGLMPNLLGLSLGWLESQGNGLLVRAIVVIVSLALMVAAGRIGSRVQGRSEMPLSFSLALIVVVLVSYQASVHDLCLLILPLVFVGDYCGNSGMDPWKRKRLLLPILPIVFSPLWMILWLVVQKENLMAVVLLWWTWEIVRVIRSNEIQLGSRAALRVNSAADEL